MGRRKKPAEVQAQRGDPGHRGADKAAARASASVKTLTGKPPFPLIDAFAREMWTHLSEMLRPLGFVRKTDEIVLATLCDTLSEYRRCRLDLAKAGGLTYEAETYLNAKGEETGEETAGKSKSRLIRAHPAVMIMRRARNDIVDLCEKLGMTPGTRYSLLQQASDNIERPDDSRTPPPSDQLELPDQGDRPPHLYN